MSNPSLPDTPAYKNLEAHHAKLVRDRVHMRELFAADPQRFAKFTLHFARALHFLFVFEAFDW